MAVAEITKQKKELKITAGNLYETIQPQQGERIMIIGGSETLAACCSDAGAIVLPAVVFSQIKKNKFDTVAAPLSIHKYAEGARWTAQAYDVLKEGGRFVVDFAEASSLSHTSEFPYMETLSGYWERLKEAGFTTILFQQLTAQNAREAILKGWTELVSSEFPVTVNRFIAIK